MLTSGNAWAGTNITVKTTDSRPGGGATFQANRDTVAVCDLQEDGYAAVGYLRRHDGPLWSTTVARGYNKCEENTINIPEGQKVTLTVCLRKAGRDSYCRTDSGAA